MWAEGMVCWSGKVGSVVLWMRRAEEPLAERREVGVGAREKISAGCAGFGRGVSLGWEELGGREGGDGGVDVVRGCLPSSTVWAVRYCFDWEGVSNCKSVGVFASACHCHLVSIDGFLVWFGCVCCQRKMAAS